MHNYKTKAEHWKRKLMHTPANYVCLATYRFKQWEHYRNLARQDVLNHLKEADNDANIQQTNH